MNDFQARQVAELHGLLCERVNTGDHGLGGDDGGHRGEEDDRDERGFRHEAEKVVEVRLQRGLDIGEHQCALTEVVQHQGRQHDDIPAAHQRWAAKVADVGIHGLATGDSEQDEAHEHKALVAVVQEEIHPVVREQRGEDAGVGADVNDAEHGQGDEPQHHDRPKGHAYARGAMSLDQKQRHDDAGGDRDDVFGQTGAELSIEQRQTLHGGQNGDRGSDHPIAVEKAGTENADQHHRAGRLRFEGPLCGAEEGQQGKHAALAVVGGLGDEGQVFEADHDQQGPEHEG